MNVIQLIHELQKHGDGQEHIAFRAESIPEILIPSADYSVKYEEVGKQTFLIFESSRIARGFNRDEQAEELAAATHEEVETRQVLFIGYEGPWAKSVDFLRAFGIEVESVEDYVGDGFVALAYVPDWVESQLRENGSFEAKSGECSLSIEWPDHWPG